MDEYKEIEEESMLTSAIELGLVLSNPKREDVNTNYIIRSINLIGYTNDGLAEIIDGEDSGALFEVLEFDNVDYLDFCVLPMPSQVLSALAEIEAFTEDYTWNEIASTINNALVGHNLETKKCIDENGEYYLGVQVTFNEKRKIPSVSILEPLENLEGFGKEQCSFKTETELDKYIKSIDRKKLQQELKETIIAQDEVVDTLSSLILYNQNLFIDKENIELSIYDKEHAIIAGKTGTGKSEIVRQIANKLKIPYVVEHAPAFTEEGYVGRSVSEIPKDLIRAAGGNKQLAERGIVILDEIDKKSSKFHDKGVSTTGVQNALLPLLDSKDKIKVNMGENSDKETIDFDTSRLTVILMGAFTDIKDETLKNIGFNKEPQKVKKATYTTEDFIKAGMEPEFMGRISTCLKTNDLSKEDLANILKNSKISPLVTKINTYKKRGINLTYDEEFINAIAEEAYKSGNGARGLKKAFAGLSNDLRNAFLDNENCDIKLEKDKVRVLAKK